MSNHLSDVPAAVMATREQSKTLSNLDVIDSPDMHRTEQLMYQSAVVLAALLFFVSIWNL